MLPEDIAAFIGFRIPDELKVKIDQLVQNLRSDAPAHQGMLYADVVNGLVNESMDTFFSRPVKEIGVSGMGEKIVTTGVKSAKKAVSLLVGSLAKKLSNAEMKPLAEYFYQIIYESTSEVDQDAAFMVSPVGFDLDQELLSIIKDIEAGETGTNIESRLSNALLEVNDISLQIFFAEPLKMIKLGLVMKKASQVAYEGTAAAIRGVIKKVFKGMNEQQLRGVAQYIRSVRYSRNLLRTLKAA